MNYWLIKFAPFRYSWSDVLCNGRFEIYGVRNAQARNNLQQMRLGDEVLFYHSQQGNEVMGRMKVVDEVHQDSTTANERWVSVTFEPVESFKKPVSLITIKSIDGLNTIGLIKQPRLAVMPLRESEFLLIQTLPNS